MIRLFSERGLVFNVDTYEFGVSAISFLGCSISEKWYISPRNHRFFI